MLSRTTPQAPAHDAVTPASGIVELLDLMWERARGTTDTRISTSQLRLMYLVDRDDEIGMSALGKLLNTKPPAVSRLCDRLQAAGLLQRHPCPHSGREINLRLTNAGKTHLDQIRAHRNANLARAIDALPAADRRALATGLTALETALAPPPAETSKKHGSDTAA
ncbi:MarR family transcriptional regulator [Streptomyces asoensis]|uniref:MarR family winged helix-turn-helix transcriptional regulator n=1 Tax=Streptomyces asoensis TaxID=249586 RepID=UPI0033D9278A